MSRTGPGQDPAQLVGLQIIASDPAECSITRLAVPHSAQGGDHVPHVDTAGAAELAQGELHEVEGAADEEEDEHVGDEEGTASVLVGCEGKSPDISKSWKRLS